MSTYTLKLFIFFLQILNFKISFCEEKFTATKQSCRNELVKLSDLSGSTYQNSTKFDEHYKNLDLSKLDNIILNAVETDFCKESIIKNTIELSNFTNRCKYLKSSWFCSQINEVNVNKNVLPLINDILNSLKDNSTKCVYFCTKNLNLDLRTFCSLLLYLYTGKYLFGIINFIFPNIFFIFFFFHIYSCRCKG